jgi:hypothetical protein
VGSPHLRLLRKVSRTVNGSTGKVLYEIVTDGSVYYGTKNHPGDTNETAEFATAVARLWRWTGDNEVRDDNYQRPIEGMKWSTIQVQKSTIYLQSTVDEARLCPFRQRCEFLGD